MLFKAGSDDILQPTFVFSNGEKAPDSYSGRDDPKTTVEVPFDVHIAYVTIKTFQRREGYNWLPHEIEMKDTKQATVATIKGNWAGASYKEETLEMLPSEHIVAVEMKLNGQTPSYMTFLIYSSI